MSAAPRVATPSSANGRNRVVTLLSTSDKRDAAPAPAAAAPAAVTAAAAPISGASASPPVRDALAVAAATAETTSIATSGGGSSNSVKSSGKGRAADATPGCADAGANALSASKHSGGGADNDDDERDAEAADDGDEAAIPGARGEIPLVPSAVVQGFLYQVKACGPLAAVASAGAAQPSRSMHPYLRKLQRSLFPVLALAVEAVMSNPEVLREALGDAEERAQEMLLQRETSSFFRRGPSFVRSTMTAAAAAGSVVGRSSSNLAVASGARKSTSPASTPQSVSLGSTPGANAASVSRHGSGASAASRHSQHHHHHHSAASSKQLTRTPSFVAGASKLQDHIIEAEMPDDQAVPLTPQEEAALQERTQKRQAHAREHRWFVLQRLAGALRKAKSELTV